MVPERTAVHLDQTAQYGLTYLKYILFIFPGFTNGKDRDTASAGF